MDTHNVAHAHDGASLSCDRNEDLAHSATQMSPEAIVINEKSQSQEGQVLYGSALPSSLKQSGS